MGLYMNKIERNIKIGFLLLTYFFRSFLFHVFIKRVENEEMRASFTALLSCFFYWSAFLFTFSKNDFLQSCYTHTYSPMVLRFYTMDATWCQLLFLPMHIFIISLYILLCVCVYGVYWYRVYACNCNCNGNHIHLYSTITFGSKINCQSFAVMNCHFFISIQRIFLSCSLSPSLPLCFIHCFSFHSFVRSRCILCLLYEWGRKAYAYFLRHSSSISYHCLIIELAWSVLLFSSVRFSFAFIIHFTRDFQQVFASAITFTADADDDGDGSGVLMLLLLHTYPLCFFTFLNTTFFLPLRLCMPIISSVLYCDGVLLRINMGIRLPSSKPERAPFNHGYFIIVIIKIILLVKGFFSAVVICFNDLLFRLLLPFAQWISQWVVMTIYTIY